jgi:hypothetical protein
VRRLRITVAALAALLVLAGAAALHERTARGTRPAAAPGPCVPQTVPPAYAASVARAAASGRDVWGNRLLAAPDGPTLAAARSFLAPLTRALQWQGRPLTASGSYYLPLSFPFTPHGSTVYALHVADGSEIVTRRVGGPSLRLEVGSGTEAYGSCAWRRGQAALARGWLPLLETTYVDAGGVRYRQESFVGRAFGARSVVSFVKLVVDARRASRDAVVRAVPWRRLDRLASDRLGLGGLTRLVVSSGANLRGGAFRWRVPAGSERTIYLDWLHAPSPGRYLHATAARYAAARATTVRFWRARTAKDATFDVPEPAVRNAARAVLTQLIASGWRYSIGNPYEELSFAESLDAAEVAAEYGDDAVARSILSLALERIRIHPWRFTAFRGARILAAAATYVRLSGDGAFLRSATPALAHLVARIAARQQPSGLLLPEPLSTDLESRPVDSVSGQIEAVEGLLDVARAWRAAGDAAHASAARTLAGRIERPLRQAVGHASRLLPDGSLFVPDRLGGGQRPFGLVTSSREGSYWNLVMPYAFASGWFEPGSAAARGIVRYLGLHGGRLLGVPRTYARTVYGDAPGAGLAPVYALNESRFLADQDEPGQLDLTLYGLLAAGMSPGTHVSGEAVSVLPVRGAWERSMFMPPNTGANASLLGTLRELLVHERRTAAGAPAGLDLAFSTPRAWLAPGRTIRVGGAATSFGPVSYSLARRGGAVEATLDLPPGAHARLRLRLPAGEHVVRVTAGALGPDGTIDLGGRSGHVLLRATVAR